MIYKVTNSSHSQYTFESMNDCIYVIDIIRSDNIAKVQISTSDNGYSLVVGKFELLVSDDDILNILKPALDDLADLYEDLSEAIAEIILENYGSDEIFKDENQGGFVS